jgi:hypothetical protein
MDPIDGITIGTWMQAVQIAEEIREKLEGHSPRLQVFILKIVLVKLRFDERLKSNAEGLLKSFDEVRFKKGNVDER